MFNYIKSKGDVFIVFCFLILTISIALAYKAAYISLYNFLNVSKLSYSLLIDSGYSFSFEKFLTAIVLAPVFETAIFIVLFKFLISFISKRQNFFILVSAFLFGAYHYTSSFLQIGTFLIGIVFAYSYCFYLDCRMLGKDKASLYTIMIHSMHNFVFMML
jgi:hypothetical protein